MNGQNERHVDELIGEVMQDRVPADVDRRLRSQLADFRARLAAADKPAMPRSTPLGRPVWRGVAAVAAVAIALTAVIGWILRPRASLAEVAAAVLQQAWIHATEIGPDGKTVEVWYSPAKDVSAWRYEKWIEYRDHRLRVYYSYDVAEKVLYRVPEHTPRAAEYYASMATALQVLLQDEQLADKPLERLEFLGGKRTDIKVLDQKLEKVEVDGRRWLDYRLTLRYPVLPDPIEMLIRVDAETKLPHYCRREGRLEGKRVVHQTRIDYPQQGPADVYDLGVPKTAKLVDRVPSDQITRILKTLRAGRQRMDDYRAVFVRRSEPEASAWWLEPPMILYRKGDKFRADCAFWSGAIPPVEKPTQNEDLDAWWKKRADGFLYYPIYITRGSTVHHVKHRFVTDADGSMHVEVESVERRDGNQKPGETYPPYRSWRPEFACRPPLGIPSQELEPVLDLNPKGGPAGTVLLRVRRTGRVPGGPDPVPEGLPPSPDIWRYWLDPARDYAVVRWDMLGHDDSGNEEITHSTSIDQMARSPQGTWYAARIRRTAAIRDSSGKVYDQLLDLYLDFDADLPDSLFEPPKPGRIY